MGEAMNPQVMIHTMKVKAERLEYALRSLMESVFSGTVGPDCYEMALSLGCLGGDDLAKRLVKNRHCPKVLADMVLRKFLKQERADKLTAEFEKRAKKQVDSTSGFVVYFSTNERRFASGKAMPVPEGYLDKIQKAFDMTGAAPLKISSKEGKVWVKGEAEKVKDGVYKVAYTIERKSGE